MRAEEDKDLLGVIDRIDPRLACLAWHNYLRKISNIFDYNQFRAEENFSKDHMALRRSFFELAKELRRAEKTGQGGPNIAHNFLNAGNNGNADDEVRQSVAELKKYVNGKLDLSDSHLIKYLGFKTEDNEI